MRKIFATVVWMISSFAVAGEVTVTGVSAQQRYPWNGCVDVEVRLAGSSNDVMAAEYVFSATECLTHAVIKVAHIERTEMNGNGNVWTNKYLWIASADMGNVMIDAVDFTVGSVCSLGGIQLWENGPYWAECNLGASKPEQCGYYFWWGDTVGYAREGGSRRSGSNYSIWSDVTWVSSTGARMSASPFDSSSCPTSASLEDLQLLGYVDSTGNLTAAHDAASIHLGSQWRMPRDDEMNDLATNCVACWTTREGVHGCLVTGTGKYATHSIFLPAAGEGDGSTIDDFDTYGYYWSSTPMDHPLYAWCLAGCKSMFGRFKNRGRYGGQSVRPVHGNTVFSAATTKCVLDGGGSPVILPISGTTFDTSLTVNISCASNGATIHYTTNGTTPTVDSPIYKRFKIFNRTTVKAIACFSDGAKSSVAVAEYAKGNSSAPMIVPIDGAVFQHSNQEVSIEREGSDGVLRYTIDGSEPTKESPVYAGPFRISETTTVKAKIFGEEYFDSDVSEALLTREWVVMPVPEISPSDGSTFLSGGQEVTIVLTGEEGIIRYTIDGSEPNNESPVYVAPFLINETTVVKAKAFCDDFLPSPTAVAVLTRERFTVATPEITAPKTFSGLRATVFISCATVDAAIRYTLNGDLPTLESTRYDGAFDVTNTCAIKARAFKSDYIDSAMATASVLRVWSIGDALDDPDRIFTTDSDVGWVRDTSVSYDGVESMRSGTLGNSPIYGNYVSTIMTTTVNGRGTVRFRWRSSCEDDAEWDHGEFVADGQTIQIYGETSWRLVSYTFDTDGDHVVSWRYLKDDFGAEGSDCIWVDQFHWTPECTTNTVVRVPGTWIDRFFPLTFDYEATARRMAANGVNSVEEAYVAGLDPTNANSVFQATVAYSNGMIYIGWNPNLNENSTNRIYKVFGRTDLTVGEWESPSKSEHRFFKVAVTLPSGAENEETAVADRGFVPTKQLGGVQLWKDGPYWAECNLGAKTSAECGYHFWWGDTVGYKPEGGTWSDGAHCSGVTWVSSAGIRMTESPFEISTCPTYGKDNSALLTAGYTDSTGNLGKIYDAATIRLGTPWRMPTLLEVKALYSNCTTTWITTNGVSGRLVIGKDEFSSRQIFLPATGYGDGSGYYYPDSEGLYWTSTPMYGDAIGSWGLLFVWNHFYADYTGRCLGRAIRPVRDAAE